MLDVALAVVVARVGFAGEDELDGAVFVASELYDVIELLEDERGAFVGGKAAGEADGQGIGIEQLVEGDEVALGEGLALDEQAAPGELDQLAAEFIAQGPEFLVGDEVRVEPCAARTRAN